MTIDLQAKVRMHGSAIASACTRLREARAFSLEAPCVLIRETEAVTTAISSLRTHLRASEALSSAPIEAYLQLVPLKGQQAAFEECANGPDGETFCEAWDRAQAEATEALATFDDLAAMALQAARGWGRSPKEILVVAVEGSQVSSGLVAA